MFILILLISYLLFWTWFYLSQKCWRRSFITASIIWGSVLVIITESLGALHYINLGSFFFSWLIVSLVTGLLILLKHNFCEIQENIRLELLCHLRLFKSDKFLSFALLGIVTILAGSLLLALICPPNNWDSMTYHMSRVANWLQNQSLEHYPTHNIRQLDSPPWSSLAILNFQVLSGGNHYANIVQWSSMVGCLIGISLIAKQLGANLRGQILSSIICMSLPMGILQSVTTQNDYVVSFWLVCFVYCVFAGFNNKLTFKTNLLTSLSLGLALLTKGTAYIYAFPFVIIWLILNRRFCQKHRFSTLFPVLLPIVFLNASHWLRNIQIFGTPLGVSGDITKNQLFTLAAFISNLARNLSLHLTLPSPFFNLLLQGWIIGIHKNILKIDVSDPRTTFLGTTFTIRELNPTSPFYFHEDYSGNFLQLFLFCLAVIGFVFFPKARTHRLKTYIYAIIGTLIFFNVLLAWQPWGSRLHLPFFVLVSAFTGTVIGKVIAKKSLSFLLAFFLTISAIPPLLFSASRPIFENSYFQTISPSVFNLTKEEITFVNRSNLKMPYLKSLNSIADKQCYDIGLYLGEDSWDYPLWVIAKQTMAPRQVRFRAINVAPAVENISSNPNQTFIPCAILSVDRPDVGTRISVTSPKSNQTIQYLQDQSIQGVGVFFKQ